MTNLIDEITQADQKLEAAEIRVTEASRQLRAAKRELKDCRHEIRLLIKELGTGQSRYPIFERIARSNGATADEHQRGPTVFPKVQAPAPEKLSRRYRPPLKAVPNSDTPAS